MAFAASSYSNWETAVIDPPSNGRLGRSTADLAFALSTIAGPDLSTSLSVNEPGSLFARALKRSFKGLRIGWFKGINGIPIDPRPHRS